MLIEENGDWLPLDLLPLGREGKIVDVAGEPAKVHQLAEVGLRQGCGVRVLQAGQPSLLVVDGRRLTVRLGNEVEIFVQPVVSSRAG